VYLLAFAIMYVYLCAVINVTQFPIYASDGMRAAMDGQNVWREMNLIPFQSIRSSLSTDIILNVILTIPFGFGLPFLIRTEWKKIVLSGIGIGAAVEAGQLISALMIGFTFRHVNIDDVILNLLGTAVGYIIFLLVRRLFLRGYQKAAKSSHPFMEYIAGVCRNSPQ
jgi:glycopeptide antibiotics resistance protein